MIIYPLHGIYYAVTTWKGERVEAKGDTSVQALNNLFGKIHHLIAEV